MQKDVCIELVVQMESGQQSQSLERFVVNFKFDGEWMREVEATRRLH